MASHRLILLCPELRRFAETTRYNYHFFASGKNAMGVNLMMETHYVRLGGDEIVRKLADRFYDLMHLDPDFHGVRKLHSPDLTGSRNKLYWFLSGWLGGPPLYTDRFGHPALRRRHLPFAIGMIERDQWMACMERAMEDLGVEVTLKTELIAAFFKTADFMRNKTD